MRNVSVFISVRDELYNMVVEPYKKTKSFSKLITSLLEGYLTDDYIRAFVDGTIDLLRKESEDSLEEALNEMRESLSNMGVYTNSLKSVNRQGSEYFRDKAEGIDVEARGTGDEKSEVRRTGDDVKELVVTLREVLDQNREILSLLKEEKFGRGDRVEPAREEGKVVEMPVNVKAKVEEKMVKSEEKPNFTSEPEDDDDDILEEVAASNEGLLDEMLSEQEDLDLDLDERGLDIMNSLIQGNYYSS